MLVKSVAQRLSGGTFVFMDSVRRLQLRCKTSAGTGGLEKSKKIKRVLTDFGFYCIILTVLRTVTPWRHDLITGHAFVFCIYLWGY